MEEWEDEILVCSNCGDRIEEGQYYFRFMTGSIDLILCESCHDDCKHWN